MTRLGVVNDATVWSRGSVRIRVDFTQKVCHDINEGETAGCMSPQSYSKWTMPRTAPAGFSRRPV